MQERVSWRTAWNLRMQAGKASSYIKHLGTDAYPGLKVILVHRVSYCTQDRRGNLANQLENLRRCAADAGAVVVSEFPYIGSGKCPSWLEKPAELARTLVAALLVESTDRYIRHQQYHPNEFPDAQATEDDLAMLRWHTQGVTLMTVLPPDASPSEVKSYQRKRGQEQKGSKGGRPKNRHPKQYRPETKAKGILMHDLGFSYQEVADFLTEQTKEEVPRQTVRGWFKARPR